MTNRRTNHAQILRQHSSRPSAQGQGQKGIYKHNEKTRLVYADDIKEYLEEKAKILRLSGGDFEAVNQIYKDINSVDLVPTADATPVVHGRWMSVYDFDSVKGEDVRVGFLCDKCGAPSDTWHNYCPDCGAKMHHS